MKQNRRYRDRFNPKRDIRDCSKEDEPFLEKLCSSVSYGGNPQHKKNPGDFGLEPPCEPRTTKSLCDAAAVFRRSEAIELLKCGIARGLVSRQVNEHGFPQNIWSVKRLDDGSEIPLEAQLENPQAGAYHGYPLPPTDPMYERVLVKWRKSQCLIL